MRATQSIVLTQWFHVMLTTALSLPISQYYCVTIAAISGIYSKRVYSASCSIRVARLALLGQIWEFWFPITLVGPKVFVWPFGSFLAIFQDRFGSLQELGLTVLGSAWETIYFHFFDKLYLQIFTKFSYFEGFRLQNFVRIFRFSELMWK